MSRFFQFRHNVCKGGHSHIPAFVSFQIDLAPQCGPLHRLIYRSMQVAGYLLYQRVALRMYSTRIKGLLSSQTGHLQYGFPALEGTVAVTVVHHGLGCFAIQPGDIGKKLLAGGQWTQILSS